MNAWTGPVTSVLAILVLASNEAAAGVIDLSWTLCPSPIRSHEQVQTGGQHSLVAYVIGQTEPFTGSYVRIVVTNPQGYPLPDAWRFDAAGCQSAGSFSAYSFIATFSRCPNLRGALAATEISSYEYDDVAHRAEFTHEMHLASTRSIDPDVRHMVVAFRFDHQASAMGTGSLSLPCGGLADQVCFRVESAGFLTEDQSNQDWIRGATVASASGLEFPAFSCEAVDAWGTTWGAIKSLYRR